MTFRHGPGPPRPVSRTAEIPTAVPPRSTGSRSLGAKPSRVHPIVLALAVAATLPGVWLTLSGGDPAPAVAAATFGLAVVGAAFLVSWAAEVAQLDISAGLAIGILALIAVLPEYAVSAVFAWQGGEAYQQYGVACMPPGASGESPCSLALANMTGANRLLIGIGWTMVVFVAWFRWRRRGQPQNAVRLPRTKSVEVAYLAIACIYGLTLPLKESVTLIDALVLVAVFVAYVLRIARSPSEPAHLVGPAAWIGAFPRRGRRVALVALFLAAAAVIILVAEAFAEALVDTGHSLGISEFLLVQWVAPLASEAPELLVAFMFAWRLRTTEALSTLVSSKVNQWTLLLASLPIIFSVAAGTTSGLPLVGEQRQELLLTAAQSVLALALLVNLELTVREAGLLFGLFFAQFALGAVIPASAHGLELVVISIVYLVLAAYYYYRQRGMLFRLVRAGLKAPYEELATDAPKK